MSQPLPGLDRSPPQADVGAPRSTVHLNPRGVIVRVLRAARVVGDHDLNTFLVRADPVVPAPATRWHRLRSSHTCGP